MICLDNTDTLEGGASVTNVVDYTVHGLVGTTFTNIAQGQLSDTNPSVLYTAGAAISIVSVIYVNTHSTAVTVDLYLDPANAGTPRRLIPKTLSLGVGYSMHFDGQRCSILDASGNLMCGFPSPLGPTKGGTGLASYTQGDTLYASAANVLGALGIGAANLKKFVNAAGTTPEWAAGMSSTYHTYDVSTASGNQTLTGAGFTPSKAMVMYSVTGVTGGVGMSNGANSYSVEFYHSGAGYSYLSTNFIFLSISEGNTQSCTLTFNADGGVLAWGKVGSPTGTLLFAVIWFR